MAVSQVRLEVSQAKKVVIDHSATQRKNIDANGGFATLSIGEPPKRIEDLSLAELDMAEQRVAENLAVYLKTQEDIAP